MGDADDRTGILMQMLLQPVNRLGIEVVGRLIEQEDIGLLQKQTTEGNASAFTTREILDNRILIGATKRIHRATELLVEIPSIALVKLLLKLTLTSNKRIEIGIRISKRLVDFIKLSQHIHDGLHTFLHHFANGFLRVELRILLQISHRIPGREYYISLVVMLYTCNNLKQSRFAGTIHTDNTYFCAIKKGEVDVVEDFLLRGERLAHTHHRENDFFIVCHIFVNFGAKIRINLHSRKKITHIYIKNA